MVDAATGSSLLRIEDYDGQAQRKLTSSLLRSECVGEILAQSDEPQSLLTEIQGIESIQPGWALDYLRLQQNTDHKTTDYTSR